MSAYEWVGLITFLVLQAFVVGVAWENLRGRVKHTEGEVLDLKTALSLLAETSARTVTVQREDEKILQGTEVIRREMREGFSYFGECLGQITMQTNTHESWLAAIEKRVAGAAGSRPRIAAVRPPAKAPEWLSPRSHVPPLHSERDDPRREKP